MVESFFFLWAISTAYQQKQKNVKLNLESEKSQYYEAALHFVPKILLDLLGKDDIRNIEFGSTVSLIGTVVFIDIKGFSQWSEFRTPEEIIAKTNDAWASLIPDVEKNNGAVVSFTGDGLILLFPKNSLDALTFIVTTLKRKKTDPAYNPLFDFGIDVHFGPIILGTVGESSQMQLTVLSDIVNTATRIESVTHNTKTMIVVSAAFVKACGLGKKSVLQIQPSRYKCGSNSVFTDVGMRFLGARRFKGKHGSIEIYDISFVEDPAEFKQSVDFINRNEILKHGVDTKYHSASALTQPKNKCLIVSHYIKHAEKTDLSRDSCDESEVA